MQTVTLTVGNVCEGAKVRLAGKGGRHFRVEMIDGQHALMTDKQGEIHVVSMSDVRSIV